MIDENIIEKLAKIAYITYTGMKDAAPEEYHTRDILEYDKLPERSKKHWVAVARAVVLASWNINAEDLK